MFCPAIVSGTTHTNEGLHLPDVLASSGDTSGKGLAAAVGALLQACAFPVRGLASHCTPERECMGSKEAMPCILQLVTYVLPRQGVYIRHRCPYSARQTRSYTKAQASQALPSRPTVIMARNVQFNPHTAFSLCYQLNCISCCAYKRPSGDKPLSLVCHCIDLLNK